MCSEAPADASAGQRSDALEPRVRLSFGGVVPVSVRGPVTDALYRFSQQSPVQEVDVRDAQSILRTRLFRRVS